MPGLTQDSVDPLDSLESQIEELERRIIGDCDISEKDTPIVDSLIQSNNAIHSAISSHNTIKALFDRLDQLGKFLDPSFEDSLIDTACKKKVVLESEKELRQFLLQSKKLSELNSILSGEPFKKVPNLVEQLRKVSEETIRTQSDYDKLKIKVKDLSENYITAVKALSRSFYVFETQLSDAEDGDKVTKPIDD
ncbi:dynactin subunit 3 [Halyomorpha halys]|uniref:dynactin subunit 3 n=1 Tax=Halyomorpha halys TaxID=286706 RepID=UPI0006D4F5E4|nr:uncharacterized protein LOC106680258 [Halyomorpha halys]XP_014275303.1 uncharacterized protein LOC106680258 [Halyomorpha halys]